jgi:heptaprenyl diphosphate synthase
MELLHLGSLYHDDVIDEADTRRGAVSASARWGNIQAVLGGDFLLGRAMELGASLGSEAARLVAATLAAVCDGEAMECERLYDADRDEAHYYGTIGLKTAAMIANSCRIGGLVAKVAGPNADALTEYGYHLGMAFHITDDVLDLTAEAALLGKPTANDLIEGVYSLPVIHALRDSTELRGLLREPPGPGEVERARQLVLDTGAVKAAQAVAANHVDMACAALCCPGFDPQVRDGLRRLAGILLSRSS